MLVVRQRNAFRSIQNIVAFLFIDGKRPFETLWRRNGNRIFRNPLVRLGIVGKPDGLARQVLHTNGTVSMLIFRHDNRIWNHALLQHIAAAKTDEAIPQYHIVVRTAVDNIRTFPALQEILSAAAVNGIVAQMAQLPVAAHPGRFGFFMFVFFAGINRIVTGHTDNQIMSVTADNNIRILIQLRLRLIGSRRNKGAAVKDIVTVPAVNYIGRHRTVDTVIPVAHFRPNAGTGREYGIRQTAAYNFGITPAVRMKIVITVGDTRQPFLHTGLGQIRLVQQLDTQSGEAAFAVVLGKFKEILHGHFVRFVGFT